ncbi:hypothetical protein K435DRAFT_790036 [Dendrothele bispora CBS 962.96]|uniref:Uncharacterized protein n=1 Tax=Dendrothele bispora (strain CBS 962.96) TaxID=1314807 RepID=A0A4S8MSZ2_DENBC|nr:hypothetical protein K435DRAFT_790036 [Dendrothele bispora CBS 962.96]
MKARQLDEMELGKRKENFNLQLFIRILSSICSSCMKLNSIGTNLKSISPFFTARIKVALKMFSQQQELIPELQRGIEFLMEKETSIFGQYIQSHAKVLAELTEKIAVPDTNTEYEEFKDSLVEFLRRIEHRIEYPNGNVSPSPIKEEEGSKEETKEEETKEEETKKEETKEEETIEEETKKEETMEEETEEERIEEEETMEEETTEEETKEEEIEKEKIEVEETKEVWNGEKGGNVNY